MSPQGLRQRTPQHLKADQLSISSHSDLDNDPPARDQIVWGQTPSGQGARVLYPSTLRFLADTCLLLSFPRPNHSRCNHCPLPPVLSKITHRHPQPWPACHPAHTLLHPTAHAPQDILLSLFRVLACRVRRWAWIRVDKTKQAEMDCQDGAEARVAR